MVMLRFHWRFPECRFVSFIFVVVVGLFTEVQECICQHLNLVIGFTCVLDLLHPILSPKVIKWARIDQDSKPHRTNQHFINVHMLCECGSRYVVDQFQHVRTQLMTQ